VKLTIHLHQVERSRMCGVYFRSFHTPSWPGA